MASIPADCFPVLNRVDAVLAGAVTVAVVAGDPRLPPSSCPAGGAVVVAGAWLPVIRPALNHRSDRIRAGDGPPRPRAHVLHIAAEAVKVLALLALGVGTPMPRGRP